MGTVGCYVQAEAANGNNSWEAVSEQGGTSKVDTGLIYDTDWQTVRLINPCLAKSKALIYPASSSNAEAGAEHASNIVSSGTALAFGFALKTETGTARSIDIDYVKIVSVPLVRGGY